MNHNKVVPELIDGFLEMIRSTENNDFSTRAANCCRFTHSTLGIVTEVAELKYLLDNPRDFDPNEYGLKVHNEIGDICYYLLQGVDSFDWSYEQLMDSQATIQLRSDMDPIDSLVQLAGEITDVLKKHFSYHIEIDRTKVANWYIGMLDNLHRLTKELNTTVDKCIQITTAKLTKRYPEGKFRYKDRANRDREAEKEVMERANRE
jgi:hypothetical protein